jgi:hypothetical protein
MDAHHIFRLKEADNDKRPSDAALICLQMLTELSNELKPMEREAIRNALWDLLRDPYAPTSKLTWQAWESRLQACFCDGKLMTQDHQVPRFM